jgi:hypothetical protein
VLAGVEPALNAPAMRSPEAKKQIPVCNVSGEFLWLRRGAAQVLITSGIHAVSIPQYVIGQIINGEFPIWGDSTQLSLPSL